MIRIDLGVKNSDETINYPFDFISVLAAGETIVSTTVSNNVFAGTDSSSTTMVAGSRTTAGTIVTQPITAGVSGNIYQITVTGTTSLGQIVDAVGTLVIS